MERNSHTSSMGLDLFNHMLSPDGREIPPERKSERQQHSPEKRDEQRKETAEREKEDKELERKKMDDVENELEKDEPAKPAAPETPTSEAPKTLGERMIAGAEKLGEGLAAIADRLHQWASKLGISTLKGLTMVAGALGFESVVQFLNRYIRPAEVRQLIADHIPKVATVVRDESDEDAIKTLETAYAKEVKKRSKPKETGKKEGEEKPKVEEPAESELTFIDFCKARLENLPADKAEYRIADLLDTKEQNEPVPEEKKEKEENKPEESPETLKEQRKAKYVFAIAEAFNDIGEFVPINRRQMDADVTAVQPGYYKTVAQAMIDGLKQDSFSYNWSWAASMTGNYKEARSAQLFGIELESGVLEETDGNNVFWDPNAVSNFEENLTNNPEIAIRELLAHEFKTGRAKNIMPTVQKNIRLNLKKYGIETETEE